MSHACPPLILLIAALSISAPARAQEPAQTVPPAESPAEAAAPAAAPETAEEAISPEEAAFNVRSAALGERVLAVDAEMKSAARLVALDPEVARTALDEIQTGFQTEVDGFIQAFLDLAAQKSAALPEDQALTLRTNATTMAEQLAILPMSMRDQAETAARQPPPSEVARPAE